jgi:hypothetical protein
MSAIKHHTLENNPKGYTQQDNPTLIVVFFDDGFLKALSNIVVIVFIA